jgi:NIPSNAP
VSVRCAPPHHARRADAEENVCALGLLRELVCCSAAWPPWCWQIGGFWRHQTYARPELRSPAAEDGQQDFDFEIGRWKTHISRLEHPLSGANRWVDYDGTSVVRKIWNGRANLLELEVEGPAGRIEELSLRLYHPESCQWSLNFVNSRVGTLSQPTIGEFKNKRGEFFDQEEFNGRAVLVRFVISDITPDSCRFEQAFSADGGKTWEVNWIATDTRIRPAPLAAEPPAGERRRKYPMIVEMRTYKTKPGRRPHFLEIFGSRSVPAHAEIGMKILGPFLSIDPDTFFFMRGFPDEASREPMKARFYEGALWKEELERVLMPMLENYRVVVVDDDGGLLRW